MKLGTYVDGRELVYDETDCTYNIGGTLVTKQQVVEYDDWSQISWVSDDARRRVRAAGSVGQDEIHPLGLFGFRTKTWWKMALAVVYYGTVALMLLAIFSPSDYAKSGYDSALDIGSNVVLWLMLLSPALLFSDFGYRDRLPLLKRRRLWSSVAALAVCALFALSALGVADSLHSSSYKSARDASSEAVAPTVLNRPKATAPQVPAPQTRPTTDAPEPDSQPAYVEETQVQEPEQSLVTVVTAEVVRVVDGDTAVFRLKNGGEEKVRFIGVDTPESTNEIEPYGKEASAYTKGVLAAGTQVYLEQDAEERDRYGRMLAYVWLDKPTEISASELREKLFNAQLAAEGYAQQMTIAPNVKYADYFGVFVAEARGADRGLWDPALVEKPAAAQTAPKSQATKKSEENSISYIGNRNTRKFHYPDCRAVGQMKESNKVSLSSRKKAISSGYVPCKICEP